MLLLNAGVGKDVLIAFHDFLKWQIIAQVTDTARIVSMGVILDVCF